MSEQASELSMSGAAFNAFRKRARGGVLLRATLCYLLLAALLFGAMVAIGWSAFGDYLRWSVEFARSDPFATDSFEAAFPLPPASVLALAPLMIVIGLFSYALFGAYEAACLRWLVRGEAGQGFGGITFGADTWRVVLGYLLWVALGIAAEIVFFVIVGGAGVATFFASGQNIGLAALVAIFLLLACLCALAYVAVRFAPAAATSIAMRRFSFFSAWNVTRGRFWSLFGAFAFLIILYVAAAVVLYGAGVFILLSDLLSLAAASQMSSEAVVALLLRPEKIAAFIVLYALAIGLGLFLLVALFGVNARAAAVAQAEGRIPTPPPGVV